MALRDPSGDGLVKSWSEHEIQIVLAKMVQTGRMHAQLPQADCDGLADLLGRDATAVRRKSWDIHRVWRGDQTNKGGRTTTRLVLRVQPSSVIELRQSRTSKERATLDGPGFVYALTGPRLPVGDFKIGCTTDHDRRLREARTFVAFGRFEALVRVEHCADTEDAMHIRFSDRNVTLEHFRDLSVPEVRSAFSTVGVLL